jgi:Anti-sigma factor NepR
MYMPFPDTSVRGRCAAVRDLYEARLDPREGDERLSAKKRSEPDEAHDKRAKKPSQDKTARKQRSTDLGRALRTIYDDTLRESVPDDFLSLIGKLS